ncbi:MULTISPECIES: sensor histidine kinase [unclassified Butyrivibrio]|uniref:sensor histidine kinase n=1 Tax=unclassified Butyrivibrio TaxID=2639466 RepID=UPI0003B76638|nr:MULTISPECIES: ATP-binding protein [unclassified Butyrivibrio]
MGDTHLYLILSVTLVVILIGCIAILIRNYMKLIARNDALRESIDNLCRLNDKLRMDRHDYLNHLQIVYGLMELEEYEEMNSYLRKVYKELLKTGKAVKTSKPAINALLAAKSAEAEAKEIEFLIEVKSDLKKLSIEDWELCKVLSNLIDNAVKALEDFDSGEKTIRVNITETPERYIFDVEDNGPEIPESIRESIFKKGFSTRKEEGHGMGLAIVSEILNKSGGDIELSSDEEETVFTVSFEKGE